MLSGNSVWVFTSNWKLHMLEISTTDNLVTAFAPLTRTVCSSECVLFRFHQRKIITCDSSASSNSFKPSVCVSLHKPKQPTEPMSLIPIYTKGSVSKHLRVLYKLHFEALYIAKLIR